MERTYVRFGDAGRALCGVTPPRWMDPTFDDRAWSDPSASPDGGACTGNRSARWVFDVGPELSRLATITLRVRYRHGFAAYLNGVEIARARLEAGAAPEALATDVHGLEAESYVIPVRAGLLHTARNVLAIEAHPHTAGLQAMIDAQLTASDGPRLVRGPYLQRISPSQVTIVFDTDLPTLGQVRYGATEHYDHTVGAAPPATHHVLDLVGLAPASLVHYRVTARGGEAVKLAANTHPLPLAGTVVDSGDLTFHTPPSADGRPLRFLIYGDVRSGHDVHAQLDRRLAAEDADLAIVTGDLVGRGSEDAEWEKFFEISGPLLARLAIFPAPGNHEYARLGPSGIGADRFRAFFAPLLGDPAASYYSFDEAGVHFVALDSNAYLDRRQIEWLERDLSTAEKRGARAVIVFAHQGPYTSGMHGNQEDCIRDYVPILVRHHVALFIGGHDHHYERGRVGALNYLISGGGGADLRPLRCAMSGSKPCGPTVLALANEYHYLVVEVMPTFLRLCPKRLDGAPLEACTVLPLR
ncbi:MAG TPA: metallophosphoesterase [Polyangia bacterium]|nr:metallophosphoesterase [Polyangia bacterium]